MKPADPTSRRWNGLPLSFQITALLLAGLVLAQLATLLLTLILPPEPQRLYELEDIARVLADRGPLDARMERVVASGPPQPAGPGWLTSERSRRDLAQLVALDESEVRLFFFTPLPFAGTAQSPARAVELRHRVHSANQSRTAHDTRMLSGGFLRANYMFAQAGPGGPGGGMSGMGGGGMGGSFGGPGGDPRGGFGGMPNGSPGGYGNPGNDRGAMPGNTGGRYPNGAQLPAPAQGVTPSVSEMRDPAVRTPTPSTDASAAGRDSSVLPGDAGSRLPGGATSTSPDTALPAGPQNSRDASASPIPPGSPAPMGDSTPAASSPATAMPPGTGPASTGAKAGTVQNPASRAQAFDASVSRFGGSSPGTGTPPATGSAPVPLSQAPAPAYPAPAQGAFVPPATTRAPASPRHSATGTAATPRPAASRADEAPESVAAPTSPAASSAASQSLEAARTVAPSRTAQSSSSQVLEQPPGRSVSPSRGLFGLGPAPFVEGDFIAAMKLPNGSWAVVQPVPEPFPNAWQRRVLLWFLIASLFVAPAGWWYSRRLARPITGFAQAAEQLGRDPRRPIAVIGGPAEVGRAAQALNGMQSRLRSFVDDRTAMIGAISHDLRTPLTRMRFRVEDAPDEIRVGMLGDVEEMERMITSVLDFLRDGSEPGSRERLDLATLVEDVVEEARFVGKEARLERREGAVVEVDVIGIRRVLDNLIENAVKYGQEARVRMFFDRQDVVAEISDSGPGLRDDELEAVFKPFYRGRDALRSRKSGSGLGLAVCRSIARAHGGNVRLQNSPRGLVAQLRIPLVLQLAES